MKWKIRKPQQLGDPMRQKDWIRFAEAIRAFVNDLACNHPVNMKCEQVDVDIKTLEEAFRIAHDYWLKTKDQKY